MTVTTTIKVPAPLRDRIARRAQRDHVTLATAIERAFDEADERAFWLAVRDEHAALTDHERTEYDTDPTLRDDLTDDADDALSAEDAW